MSAKEEKINFRDRDILFVDLETTGLDFEKHEILEVGCLLVNGRLLSIKEKYYAKVRPMHLEIASEEALRISKYSEVEWRDAKPLEKILKDIAKLAPNAMVAGWKVDFDWYFLEKGFKKYNIKHSFDYHLIDCISIAYYYFRDKKEPAELRLGSVCRTLEIPIHEKHGEGEGHGAMTDILATFEVFKKLTGAK
ncbi:hypothetical protein A2715_04620 [Candidatus Woesebacteria bacterium RIFCSPHIGHO2_01_FULL_39_32]|uniref:Exonuclease domain-containing protein n=1 Tax=Candidatus Woesebacteria bacterium RIFCSPLOWO2_01_FULL_39_25 TaxID=1802521 RepID=A0A1F8BLD1_9BACT|nr:MAG: hypothetical protein A2124_05550 [Candidatus Woesebacteria bacterium GWB1_37_5]OGM25301.1 MAG: hypothetical protein A2715_04620 [Candidatus Woesebacteria bacterium RIFCSPHIGHO2_01_FULL_39_32]OGM37800.1 MAG: hypothetical protein A3F01_01830 [Candidatus Woesebacteria bacterium RIFCSPHIGHO2_12_FULL_38_11]OGM64832.1 MAG: hypothetical protein A2893_04230 [Candidatus Woesebacteria bacterium RIFCSPLOWO2_01_FULL_39_25]